MCIYIYIHFIMLSVISQAPSWHKREWCVRENLVVALGHWDYSTRQEVKGPADSLWCTESIYSGHCILGRGLAFTINLCAIGIKNVLKSLGFTTSYTKWIDTKNKLWRTPVLLDMREEMRNEQGDWEGAIRKIQRPLRSVVSC